MSKHDLPDGWCLAKISDISHKTEQRRPESSEQFFYVDIGSINRELKQIESPQYIYGKDAPSRARKVIHAGDILVSLTRPNLNAVALVPMEYSGHIASTGFEVIKPILVDSRYIFFLTRTSDFIDTISGTVRGALYPATTPSNIQAYTFPLPPLAEQKVIVERLDILLAKVQTIKESLERIFDLLKAFRQSVLTAAMNGKLTEEWRYRFNYSFTSWSKRKLDDISSDVSYGYTSSSSNLPIGPKMLRITDIQDNRVNWDDVPYCEIGDDKKKKYLLEIGDLIFARTGATVGKSFLIKEKPPESVYASYLIRVRCTPENSMEYLALFFQSSDYWEQITEFAAGIAQPNVNGTKLKNLLVPIPPLEEQLEIVRRVENLFNFTDSIEQKSKDALERINKLTQFILAKAFSGGITTDWRLSNPDLIRGENSAESLLKKIRTEHNMLKKQPRKLSTRKKQGDIIVMNKLISVLEEFGDWIEAQEAFRLCGVVDGVQTERIEELYSELRDLDKAGRLEVNTITDERGRKLYDQLKLVEI